MVAQRKPGNGRANAVVSHLQRALPGIRSFLLALIADLIVIGYIVLIGSFLAAQLFGSPNITDLVPFWLITLLVLETCLLWQSFGRSIGMKLLGVEVAAEGRSPLARLLRFVASNVTLASVVGILFPLWDKNSRTLHDRMSGTVLRRSEAQEASKTPWYRTARGWVVFLTVFLTLIAGVIITEVRFATTGGTSARRVFRELFTPDWSIFSDGLLLIMETIFMALMATLMAIVIAVPLSFLAARNLATTPVRKAIYNVLRAVLSIMRSIEPILWAVIFLIVVKSSNAPFAGVLALFIHSIADLTKLYSERLESIEQGPVEAITATGATQFQVILHGIIPQIVNPYLSFTLYRWDINVRMATILGAIGGGGIGGPLLQYINHQDWDKAAVLMLLIIITVWAMDNVSSRMRKRFEEGGSAAATELVRLWHSAQTDEGRTGPFL